MPDHAALLMVGDVDQLPSVGPGGARRPDRQRPHPGRAPHRDLPPGGGKPDHHRRAQHQSRCSADLAPPAKASDFYFVEAADGEDAAAKIVKVVAARFGLNAIRDVQVLCPMNRGSAGPRVLNAALQSALNPPQLGQASVERFGFTFRVGDKVMQTENNYDRDVFNGDGRRLITGKARASLYELFLMQYMHRLSAPVRQVDSESEVLGETA